MQHINFTLLQLGDTIMANVAFLLVAIAVFLLLRQVSLWYFKVNEQLKQLEAANAHAEAQTEYMRNQEIMMQLMLQHQIGKESKIALAHRATGRVVFVEVSDLLKSYMSTIHEYDVTLMK